MKMGTEYNFNPQSFVEVRGFHREDSEYDSDDEFSDDEELQTPTDDVYHLFSLSKPSRIRIVLCTNSFLLRHSCVLHDKVVISWHRFASI